VLDGEVISYVEVETFEEGERLGRNGGWADVGGLRVTALYHRHGVARGWSVRQLTGCAWRALTGSWTMPGSTVQTRAARITRAFRPAAGFQELTRTRRGWSRMPQQA
jgi:hypothetical protein